MNLKVQKLSENAVVPTRSYEEACGYDLYAAEDAVVRQGCVQKVKTGVAIQPPKGWHGRVSERSGVGSKGIAIRGRVIDRDYTGEIIVCLNNTGHAGNYTVAAGDKIAQIVFYKYGNFKIQEVDEMKSTQRADKGFGSSDKPADQ